LACNAIEIQLPIGIYIVLEQVSRRNGIIWDRAGYRGKIIFFTCIPTPDDA